MSKGNEKPSARDTTTMVPLLRTREVARLLGGVSEVMVYKLARAGKISYIRFRGWDGETDRETVRFTEEAVRQFVEEYTKSRKAV